MVLVWESVVALLKTFLDVDAQEFLAAIVRERGTLPEDLIAILQDLEAQRKGTGAKIPLAAILREWLPTDARRYQSGLYAIAASPTRTSAAQDVRHSTSEVRTPNLIRLSTQSGLRAFAVPDYAQNGWKKLKHVIETETVERLVMANGRPLSLDALPELRGASRPVSDVVGGINTQFAGGRHTRLVDVGGKSSRGRGHRRKLNPADEPPDHRVFFIHTSWRIENVTVGSKGVRNERIEVDSPELVRLFGRPSRPTR